MAWKSIAAGAASALGAYLCDYWRTSPEVLRYAVYLLGPVLVVDGLSAMWMQRLHRLRQAAPRDDDPKVVVYAGDTWARSTVRFGMTLTLVVLGFAVDLLAGSRHLTVLWVLLWGVTGHARATLRHLETIAKYEHFNLPIFPQERLVKLQDTQEAASGDKHV